MPHGSGRKRRHDGATKRSLTIRRKIRGLFAALSSLLLCACGPWSSDPSDAPPVTLPYSAGGIREEGRGTLELRVIQDTNTSLAYRVICRGAGSYYKVVVSAQSPDSAGGYPGTAEHAVECMSDGQPVLSGALVKPAPLRDGGTLGLSLEGQGDVDSPPVVSTQWFRVGRDGLLRELPMDTE